MTKVKILRKISEVRIDHRAIQPTVTIETTRQETGQSRVVEFFLSGFTRRERNGELVELRLKTACLDIKITK